MPRALLKSEEARGKRDEKGKDSVKAAQLQAAGFNGPTGKYSARSCRATRIYALFRQDN